MDQQLIDRVHARCEDCGQGYRVPDPERTYSCKQCGGTVRAERADEAEEPKQELVHQHLDGAVACSACHAINPHGTHFCEECGGVLGGSPEKHTSPAEQEARHAATAELKRSFAWINRVTWLYRLAAPGYALGTLFAVLGLANAGLAFSSGLLTIGVFTVLTMVLVMGAIQVHFQPLGWAVTIAALGTLSVVVSLVSAGALSNPFVWSVLWTLVFWAAVMPARRFHALIQEHPDQYVAHELQGMQVRRSLEGRSAEGRHDSLQRLLHKASGRAWKLSAAASGAFLLATGAGTYTVYANVRAPALAPVLEDFRAAWNGADLAAIGAYFPAKVRQSQSDRLAALIDGNGWTEAWPQLASGDVGEGDTQVTVEYALESGALSTRWDLANRQWFLITTELPRPPFEPAFETFLQAWKRSDLKALAGFYPADYQERMEGSLGNSFSRRGWDPFPAILETRCTTNEDETKSAVLVLDSGELTTQWRFGSSGKWRLRSFKLPKR